MDATKELVSSKRFIKDFNRIYNIGKRDHGESIADKVKTEFYKVILSLNQSLPNGGYIGYKFYKKKGLVTFYKVHGYKTLLYCFSYKR